MTATPVATVAPLIPAMKVFVCVPVVPMRMVLDSPATPVADVDVVIARGEIFTGFVTQGDVIAAGCVATERIKTGGRVTVGGCIAFERLITGGRVFAPVVFPLSAPAPSADVAGAGSVKGERPSTRSRFGVGGCVAKERTFPVAVLPLPVVLKSSAPTPTAVLSWPVVLDKSASTPVAVFQLALRLFLSASEPTAVLLTPEWFKSASSPRKVFALTVSQPSWQTARAIGESPKQARASGMSSKASGQDSRFIECFNERVVVFICARFCLVCSPYRNDKML